MKKITRILLAVIILFGMNISNVFADDSISVVVDGKAITSDVEPFIENGRTMVPVRAIFEALDAQVSWDGERKTVSAKKGVNEIFVTIDENSMMNNRSLYSLDVPAKLVNDRTFIPLRAIGEAFNCSVQWDDTTKTVTVESEKSPIDYSYTQKTVTKETNSKEATITVNYTYPHIADGKDFLTEDLVAKANEISEKATFDIFDLEAYAASFDDEWFVIKENELYGYPNIIIDIRTTLSVSEKYGTLSFKTDLELPWTGVELYTSTYDNTTFEQQKTIGEALNLSSPEEYTKVYNELFAEFTKNFEYVRYGREDFDDPESKYVQFTVSDDKVSVYMSSITLTGVGRVNGVYAITKQYAL